MIDLSHEICDPLGLLEFSKMRYCGGDHKIIFNLLFSFPSDVLS